MVHKCSSNLKKDNLQIISDQELVVVAIVDILREVESASFTVFNSLLSLVSPYKARSKSSTGWFLVSKFIRSKRVSCEEQESEEDIILDSLEKLDCALYDLVRNKKGINTLQLQKTQKGLQALESTMQEIEEGLESVFRCLIKTGVPLLSILNH
ncbi:hypothetical protein LWI29_036487 [Acer saccharum]|uniref:Uncharacterized protein n=1 Tax=Acer saccharum TaxID=4024 RepID=A0AA39RTI8_ACESA|nr:hypothetical protein LWI29_036487 [Acer saccharum]